MSIACLHGGQVLLRGIWPLLCRHVSCLLASLEMMSASASTSSWASVICVPYAHPHWEDDGCTIHVTDQCVPLGRLALLANELFWDAVLQ